MAAAVSSRTLGLGLAAALLIGGAALYAQIEGGDRGAAPVDSSNDFEVGNITVDVAAKDADSARLAGWRIAQRKGWQTLARRLTGNATSLPDGALDSIVKGIVIQDEQIGPKRYIARLGVLFDRDRAGEILGVATRFTRSPPMLVIPVMWSGGAGQVFERTTPWQEAWARYRTGGSAIDYVRPVGTGSDPLLLNIGQTGRRGRGWWRTILDQYGANDVVMPEARIYRSYPGGPVIGVFIAFHGPDRRELARATLRVESGDALPALLDKGVERLDQAYQDALRGGQLATDALLAPVPTPTPTPTDEPDTGQDSPIDDPALVTATALSLQYDTPNVASVSTSEAALSGVPGVRQATTTSLALGGVSIMRVLYDGNADGLAAALAARGWDVEVSGTTLRAKRRALPAPAAPSPTPPQPTTAPRGG